MWLPTEQCILILFNAFYILIHLRPCYNLLYTVNNISLKVESNIGLSIWPVFRNIYINNTWVLLKRFAKTVHVFSLKIEVNIDISDKQIHWPVQIFKLKVKSTGKFCLPITRFINIVFQLQSRFRCQTIKQRINCWLLNNQSFISRKPFCYLHDKSSLQNNVACSICLN